MEALKFVVVLLVFVFVQVVGVLGTSLSKEEDEAWTADNWQVKITSQGYPLERDLTMHLAELIKRSKAQQFHGLMGRSSRRSQAVRLGRKSNKGDMFVGLMGKRNLDSEEEWQPDIY
ncbi:tachykinin-4 isoform X2 [Labrus bergylta]|uniref:tachykinin-4 isoform X2 n=1 Tax=Labrus bergylta TaxID=56723 RepID=UPI0033138E75